MSEAQTNGGCRCPRHPGRRYVPVLAGCAVCVQERAVIRDASQGVSPRSVAAPPLDCAAWRRRALAIREKNFAVLAAVASLVPPAGDVDGRAARTLTVAEIAEVAHLSRKQVHRSLYHFRGSRVLWLRREKPGSFEIRFERTVVAGLLTAQASAPCKVKYIMREYKRKRERLAPYLSAKRPKSESSAVRRAAAPGAPV